MTARKIPLKVVTAPAIGVVLQAPPTAPNADRIIRLTPSPPQLAASFLSGVVIDV